jgi:hypothetical protein
MSNTDPTKNTFSVLCFWWGLCWSSF